MRISVITPCHNAGPWIATALQSVGAQSYSAHEIIVVDDSSTDDSLFQIEQTHLPVKLLHVKAGNAAVARNAGIEIATGDWIALLDADDVWYPNHLERAIALLKRTSDVAFMANHDWISLEGKPIPMPKENRCKLPAPAPGLTLHDFFEILQEGFHFGHSTVLYRRDRVLEVGMFDVTQKRRHDIDLWLRVISGQTWTYDTRKCAGYRLDTPGSISKNEMECDYFYLRALAKNQGRSESALFREHYGREARRAMGIAFVDGSPEHYTRIRKLAWPHLSPLYRFFYSCGAISPALMRRVIKTRRRITMAESRNTGTSA